MLHNRICVTHTHAHYYVRACPHGQMIRIRRYGASTHGPRRGLTRAMVFSRPFTSNPTFLDRVNGSSHTAHMTRSGQDKKCAPPRLYLVEDLELFHANWSCRFSTQMRAGRQAGLNTNETLFFFSLFYRSRMLTVRWRPRIYPYPYRGRAVHAHAHAHSLLVIVSYIHGSIRRHRSHSSRECPASLA